MLEVNTLANPEIVVENKKVTDFVTRKALALVIYLAVNPGNRSREELADLLWSNRSQEQATRNLRVALSDIRKKIGDYLSIDRNSVSILPDVKIWVDVHQLSDAIETKNLDLAISLYKGDFLASFHLRGASRFENWQVIEREKIRLELIDGLSELVKFLFKAGKSKEAIKYLIHLTTLDPLLESAHRQLMQAYFENGEESLALRQYEICKKILHKELSVSPAKETLNLYMNITQRRASEKLALPNLQNLPIFTTPFIGQTKKCRELIKILSNPEVRLLSLVGPGGYGKSRLAIQLAQKLIEQFQDGVFWVPLQALDKSSEIPVAIADAIGFTHQTKSNTQCALLDYLGSRQILLLFDNFEQLTAGASFVSEILTASRNVKIITTSRQKLNLRGETTYIVRGMSYPLENEPSFEKSLVKNYDAVKLFIKSALRSNPSFKPENEDWETIARICNLVDGMPLAIELAAGWVPVLTMVDIEREIIKGIGFLEAKMQDVEERQRSLHTIAEQSWSMLTDAEKSVFKKLSIIKGPFTRRAAEQIARTKIKELLSLSNKSFLQKDSEGLLRIHEWLRQFGEGELRKSKIELAETFESFTRYYSNYLSESWWEAWSGECPNLRLEWKNISEAMLGAARAGDFQLLKQSLLPFFFVSYIGEDFGSSAVLFSQVVAEFEKKELSDNERLTYAMCLVFYAFFLRTQCRHDPHDQAETIYKKAENLLRGGNKGSEFAWLMAIMYFDNCNFDTETLNYYAQQALKIFTILEDDYALAFTYNTLAEQSQGNKKIEFCQSALSHARKHNGTREIARALLELGRGEIEKRELEKAEKYTFEALTLYTKIQSFEGMVISNEYMGIVTHCQGKYSEAKSYYEKAYKLCDRVGWKSRIEIYKLLLGSVKIAMEEYKLGQQLVLEATTSWVERDGNKMHFWVSPPEVSSLLDHLGNPELAVILLSKSLEFPGPEFKPQFEKLLEMFRLRYSQEEMSKWIRDAKHIKPIELATAIRDVLSSNIIRQVS